MAEAQTQGLYGCETWTLTSREDKRLQVLENKVLRKIFGPKRDDQTGEWRRLHSGELHDLYGKPDIIRIVKSRRLRWAGHVTRMGNANPYIASPMSQLIFQLFRRFTYVTAHFSTLTSLHLRHSSFYNPSVA